MCKAITWTNYTEADRTVVMLRLFILVKQSMYIAFSINIKVLFVMQKKQIYLKVLTIAELVKKKAFIIFGKRWVQSVQRKPWLPLSPNIDITFELCLVFSAWLYRSTKLCLTWGNAISRLAFTVFTKLLYNSSCYCHLICHVLFQITFPLEQAQLNLRVARSLCQTHS